jgi:Deoxyribonuclease NucA/NucB
MSMMSKLKRDGLHDNPVATSRGGTRAADDGWSSTAARRISVAILVICAGVMVAAVAPQAASASPSLGQLVSGTYEGVGQLKGGLSNSKTSFQAQIVGGGKFHLCMDVQDGVVSGGSWTLASTQLSGTETASGIAATVSGQVDGSGVIVAAPALSLFGNEDVDETATVDAAGFTFSVPFDQTFTGLTSPLRITRVRADQFAGDIQLHPRDVLQNAGFSVSERGRYVAHKVSQCGSAKEGAELTVQPPGPVVVLRSGRDRAALAHGASGFEASAEASQPGTCQVAPSPGTGISRDSTCIRQSGTVSIQDLPTLAVIGTADVDFVQWNELDPKKRFWHHIIEVTLSNPAGVMVGAQTGFAVTFGCKHCHAPFLEGTPPIAVGTPVFVDFTVISPGKGLSETEQTATLTPIVRTDQATAPVDSVGLNALGARCDSEPGFGNNFPGGCVNAKVRPTFTLTASDGVPTVVQHIAAAQAKLQKHWGLEGQGPPLHRTIDAILKRRNRAKACPTRLKRPPGMSCDEYPFASTREGAASNPDFSSAFVNAQENKAAGDDLLRFYRDNRVIDGDPFFVSVS